MLEPELHRIGAGGRRKLVHEAFDGEDVHVRAQRAQRRDPHRHRRQEVMDHRALGKFIERNGIAVAAAFRHRNRLSAAVRRRAWRDSAPRAASRPAPAGSSGCCSRRRNPSRRCLPPSSSAALDFDQHRRTVRLPGMLLLAHPLHAHRAPGQRARKQCRIGRGIVGAVMAVAARALACGCSAPCPSACAAFRRWHRDRDRRPGYASRPSALPFFELRHRAGRPDRAVRTDRAACRSPDSRFGAAAAGRLPVEHRDVPRRQAASATRGRPAASAASAFRPTARRRRARAWPRPPDTRARRRRRESCRHARPCTTPGIFSHRGVVDAGELRAIAWRPHDAGVHHAAAGASPAR